MADRFHVIRLINHHFLAYWHAIDPADQSGDAPIFGVALYELELLAERGGFEPPVDFKGLRRFSKPLLSTTQPPLREMRHGRIQSRS